MQKAEFRMQNSDCGTAALTSGNARRRLALPAFCILHSALLLSLVGCSAKAKAQALPDGPPLAVPSAPAHVVAVEQIAAEEPPPEAPPAPEPVTLPTPRPAAAPPPRRAETPPAPQPPAASQQPPEAPAVRAAAAAGSADETKVKELTSKAAADLMRVDYGKLSSEGKAQYNQSKRFSDEAQKAVKERNFVYAVTLAEKAATLAAELVR